MFKKPRQIGRSNPTAHKRQVTARLKVVITPAHRYRSLFRNADPLGGLALSEYSTEQQPGDVTESGPEGPKTTGTQPQPTASSSMEGSRGVRWLDREVRSGKVAKEKLLGGEGGTPPPQRTDRILRSYSMAAPRFVLLHSFRVESSTAVHMTKQCCEPTSAQPGLNDQVHYITQGLACSIRACT